jgi:hypothetical protein
MRTLLPLLLALPAMAQVPPAGFLSQGGRTLFPIGIYELPKTDAGLKRMAASGINLVCTHSRADLDRAAAAGLLGWVPVPMQLGDDPKGTLRKAVDAVKDHPALAVWEGPDEIVWGFTAYSGLFRDGTYETRDEWWRQTPRAIAYSETQAAAVMPKLREGARLVRSLDPKRHPLWINEAAESDMKFIRQYIDSIDITGLDVYPVHAAPKETIAATADYTDRFRSIGRGRPVWMVLQAFAWGSLNESDSEPVTYPTFAETRLMAYISLTHGARGLLYWGSSYVPDDSLFRNSIYAMTSELAALQPFLIAPEEKAVRVKLTESRGRALVGDRGVSWLARRSGADWLLVLVNEDNRPHMGVEVAGLASLNGSKLVELYGAETAKVAQGGFVTRLMPYQVKVFSTSRRYETAQRAGRQFTR